MDISLSYSTTNIDHNGSFITTGSNSNTINYHMILKGALEMDSPGRKMVSGKQRQSEKCMIYKTN